MKEWNATIVADIRKWQAMDSALSDIDRGLNKSRGLDVVGQSMQRVKAFAYTYRVLGYTKSFQWCSPSLEKSPREALG